jgi:hypothetical protein
MIKSEESEKNRKILVLQSHLREMSEKYYILKGQQSSWSKDTERVEYDNSYLGARWSKRIKRSLRWRGK